MNARQLAEEIKAALGYDTRMWIDPKWVRVWFVKALTGPERATLKGLVAAHVAKPVPSPHQDLIDKLKKAWPTLTPEQKRELIKRVLLRLLGQG